MINGFTLQYMIRVVQKIDAAARGEEDFLSLWPSEILFAASLNLKLEYS